MCNSASLDLDQGEFHLGHAAVRRVVKDRRPQPRIVATRKSTELASSSAHFAGRKVVVGYRGNHTLKATIGQLDSVGIEWPWDRLFEVSLEPRVVLT